MVDRLREGYLAFRETVWPQKRRLYERLARQGQRPRVMVVACCDSRVEPAEIFDADPGTLFVVRNVANVVPPCEHGGDYHGTSAALEFAVTGLGVEHIVVMGHASCGGIAACLAGDLPEGSFIGKWMSILSAVRDEVLNAAPEDPQRALEQRAIRHSLRTLETFPFIAERIAARRLELHGAWFAIETGTLEWLDAGAGDFRLIAADPPRRGASSD